MAKQKEKDGRTYRFNLRVTPAWRARVGAEADRLGVSMADFLIALVNDHLDSKAKVRGEKGREGR
jgi:hypothetical protein